MVESIKEKPPKADSYFYLATFARLLCQNLSFDQDSVGTYQNAIRLTHDKGLQDSIGSHNAKMSFLNILKKFTRKWKLTY